MFVSNMKILPLNSQHMSLSSPTTIIQQHIAQQGGGSAGVGVPKDFTNNHSGGSAQKSSKRDQKHIHSGQNKSKFMPSNGSQTNKMQSSQPHQQQQKYHNPISSGKNKKQHYNSNSTSTPLNRKRYYQQQQQQNTLQQLQHYHQQQQYLSAIHTHQQKTQPMATPASNNNSTTTNIVNNNNSHMVKNQNYTTPDLTQNPTSKSANNSLTTATNNTTTIIIPQSKGTSTTVSEKFNCSIIPNNDCDKLSSSTEEQHLSKSISLDAQQRSAKSSLLTTRTTNNCTGDSSQAAASISCCKCCSISTKLPQQTTAGNLKVNRNKKISFSTINKSTNPQDFVEASSSHSATLPSSSSKKKSYWKSSNSSCSGGVGGGEEGGTCSNDKITVAEKFVTKICEYNCNSHSLSDNNTTTTEGDNCINSQQKLLHTEALRNPAMLHHTNGSSTGDILNILSTENSTLTSASKEISTNAALTIEISRQRNNEIIDSTKKAADSSIAESIDTKSLDAATSTESSAPNSYSLDFLHSVGVQMTRGVKLESTRDTENNMKTTTGSPPCGSLPTENSPVRYTNQYSGFTMNQRQQRYAFGGSSGNSHHTYPQQQHHHYPQPTQLTIASFMQKDMLGESLLSSTSNTNSTTSSGGHTNTVGPNNYSDQQSKYQQHYTRPHQHSRYYNNYYQTHYHQHASPATPAQQHSYGYGSNGLSIGLNLGNLRTSYNGYLNYHNGAGANNLSQYHMQPNQEQARSRMSQSSEASNSGHRKSSHGSCSSASSCSSSSSASSSSNTSCGSSHRKQQQTTSVQSQHKPPLANLNLAIETLPSKSSNQHGGALKPGHHHRGHHYGHHNNHHQHVMVNTPTTPQHQNYHNLTYVSTDGHSGVGRFDSICGTNSRACSPTSQQLPPTPSSTSNNSPKQLQKCSDPGPVAMLANLQLTTTSQLNYPRYIQNQQSTSQQFHHYQQQQFLNKKLLTPLSLSMPSPSPSPTPSHIGGTLLPQQPPLGPHNIICCAQLDEASTAAAAAAAKTGIIAGNDYDSDASSTHSSSVSNTAQRRKFQQLKSLSISSTSSSSGASLCPTGPPLQDGPRQPDTPVDISTSTAPLESPLNYTYGASTLHSYPNIQSAASTGIHNQQQFFNQTQLAYKTSANASATPATQMPQIYRNGVVSLLNLPNQSPNNSEGVCANYSEEDYQQRQQPQHFYLTSSTQPSADQLNVVSTLSVATSRSNSSSGYWSPSHQCNFLYHQLSSSGSSQMTPNTPSYASSSSSISPSLPDRADELRHQRHLHKQFPSSGSSSPSLCSSSCLNDHNDTAEGCCSTSSSSSNSSVSGRPSAFVTSSERGSAQLLAPQQQRLIAQQPQQMCSSSSVSSNNSGSTVIGAQRSRNAGNGRNQQYHSLLTSTSATNNVSSAQQHVVPHIFSHQQLQSLPPPPHNLLYNPPQAHHLRALSNSSIHDFFTHTPPDRFLARAHLIEAKEAPATLLTNSKWDNLSQDIWKKFISSQQTEETFKQKMRLWRYLYLFIKNAYPRYGLYLVGSTISGFGSDTSDVDMCLVSRSASNIDPRMEALFNLTVLRDCLSKSGEFEYFNLIEAKVPILRFRDRVHQLEVDLNFNNCVGIKNTHLLHCYSQLDWRLRPLVLVTKLWAQHHNINNAKNMTISSYSLVLMVIHFLQYAVNPPVLPCLHDMFPDKFPLLRSNDFGYVDMNETIGPHETKNSLSVGELFLNFLEYYSLFDYSQHAISVRTGGILPINVCRTAKSLKNDIHQWKELCIEEPFDLTNTARSVYDYETFERVKAVFVSSWHALRETLDLNSVFLPSIDTSTPTPLQTSTTGSTAPQNLVDNSDGFKKTNGAPTKSATENSSLLWAENRRVIDSSNISHSLTKYRDSKHLLTHCHKEMQYEHKSCGVRNTSNPSSPALISGSTPLSQSTSCN